MRKIKNFTLIEKYKRFQDFVYWRKYVTVYVWEHNATGVRLLEKQTTHKHRYGGTSQYHVWEMPGQGNASLKYWMQRIPVLARKVHDSNRKGLIQSR